MWLPSTGSMLGPALSLQAAQAAQTAQPGCARSQLIQAWCATSMASVQAVSGLGYDSQRTSADRRTCSAPHSNIWLHSRSWLPGLACAPVSGASGPDGEADVCPAADALSFYIRHADRCCLQNWAGGNGCTDGKTLCTGNGEVELVFGSWSYLVRPSVPAAGAREHLI